MDEHEQGEQIATADSLEKALATAKANNSDPTDCIKLVAQLGMAYFMQADYKKSESFLRSNIAEYDRAPYNKSLEYAHCLWRLSRALELQKRYPEALKVGTQAAEIDLAVLPTNDVRLGSTYCDLGYAQWLVNDLTSAKSNAQKAISILERFPNKENEIQLEESYQLLAEAEADSNEAAAAYRDCKKSIHIAEEFHGPRYVITDALFVRSIRLLQRCGAKKEAAHLEWRRNKIDGSAKFGLNGKDPEAKVERKQSKAGVN
jgi:hypothetical protein